MASKKRKNALPSGNIRIQVFVGVRSDGTRRYESFTSSDRDIAKRDAQEYKLKVRELLAAGVAVDDIPRNTESFSVSNNVEQALNRYVDTCEAVGLSPSTVREYEATAKRAFNSIKKVSVAMLTVSIIQDYINARSKQGVSPKTIRNEISMLSAAVKSDRPDLNFRALRMPRTDKQEIQIPSVAEIQRIVTATKGTHLYIPVLLGAFLGLRRSEIAALQWADVDLKTYSLSVHQALVSGPSGSVLKGTKTKAGTRTLKIPKAIAQALAAERGLDTSVTSLTPDAITRRWERLMDSLGMSYRFHDLRHYHASCMIAAGAPDKYITADMGHASMNMVQRVYGHIMANKQEEIFDGMEKQADTIVL